MWFFPWTQPFPWKHIVVGTNGLYCARMKFTTNMIGYICLKTIIWIKVAMKENKASVMILTSKVKWSQRNEFWHKVSRIRDTNEIYWTWMKWYSWMHFLTHIWLHGDNIICYNLTLHASNRISFGRYYCSTFSSSIGAYRIIILFCKMSFGCNFFLILRN